MSVFVEIRAPCNWLLHSQSETFFSFYTKPNIIRTGLRCEL